MAAINLKMMIVKLTTNVSAFLLRSVVVVYHLGVTLFTIYNQIKYALTITIYLAGGDYHCNVRITKF